MLAVTKSEQAESEKIGSLEFSSYDGTFIGTHVMGNSRGPPKSLASSEIPKLGRTLTEKKGSEMRIKKVPAER